MLADENFSLKESLKKSQEKINNLMNDFHKNANEKQNILSEKDNLQLLISKLESDLKYKQKQIYEVLEKKSEGIIEENIRKAKINFYLYKHLLGYRRKLFK